VNNVVADLGWLALAIAALSLILTVGRRIGTRLQLRLWGIPEALVAGLLGLLLAPAGPLPLLPPQVMDLWADLPLVLLTLVFGSLMVGKPLPQLGSLWRPVSAQVSLALVLAFGQFVVGGLAVLLILQPWLGVSPVMACLIEVAYEGGHGSAAAMGPSYASLGFPGGQDLGLAMATVGLLSSTLVGGVVVVLGRRRGWLLADVQAKAAEAAAAETAAAQTDATAVAERPAAAPAEPPAEPQVPSQITPANPPATGPAAWAVNLGLAGIAVLMGVVLLQALRLATAPLGAGVALVIDALPVFPMAIIGSLLVRWLLERSGLSAWASAPIQSQIGTLSADLLITAATAGLNLKLLQADWLPLTVLALGGLLWNLAVMLLLAPRILPADWFERAVIEFGQATGVAASGLLLLRMADPDDRSEALPAFSLKQLLLQPFLAGGVITVVAPLAVVSWGLPAWSALCFAVVLLAGGGGLLLARLQPAAGASGAAGSGAAP
jgi:ESS family glutamate:Na+ symporter